MQLVTSHRSTWLQDGFQALQTRFQMLRAAVKTNQARRARYRSTFSELSSLSSQELAELGISWSQIRSVALQEMAKEPRYETL